MESVAYVDIQPGEELTASCKPPPKDVMEVLTC